MLHWHSQGQPQHSQVVHNSVELIAQWRQEEVCRMFILLRLYIPPAWTNGSQDTYTTSQSGDLL
jgi:hypothetical protein